MTTALFPSCFLHFSALHRSMCSIIEVVAVLEHYNGQFLLHVVLDERRVADVHETVYRV